MKEWIRYILAIIIIFSSFSVLAQTKAELERKRKQKEKEIQYTKKLIAETSDKHKKTLQFLLVIKKQITSRDDMGVLLVNYNTILSNPGENIKKIQGFLELPEDVIDKMIKIVDDKLYRQRIKDS